jgi:hypothetical protein
MTSIEETLEQRGKRYGKFTDHAQVTQDLKRVVAAHLQGGRPHMAADQWEALDMIFHKIARIVCGDPNYADSWHDIAGYAKLVEDRLNANGVFAVEEPAELEWPQEVVIKTVAGQTKLANGSTRIEFADGSYEELPPLEAVPTEAAPICPNCSCAACGAIARLQNNSGLRQAIGL